MNDPPTIIKQLPLSDEKRLSKLSWNDKICNNSTPIHQEAPIKAGYSKLKYKKQDQKRGSKQQHKRQIICFNPPYIKNVTTKAGIFF